MSNFRIMVSNGIMLANKFLIQWATLEFYVIKHKLWVADKLISKFKEKHEIIKDSSKFGRLLMARLLDHGMFNFHNTWKEFWKYSYPYGEDFGS
jgi:hypothetical protein